MRRRRPRPPVTTATCSSGKISASILARRSVVAGVISDGLIIARLPAAIAVASGMSERPTGKFHGDMMPDDAERLVHDARACRGRKCISTCRFCGRIHALRLRRR